MDREQPETRVPLKTPGIRVLGWLSINAPALRAGDARSSSLCDPPLPSVSLRLKRRVLRRLRARLPAQPRRGLDRANEMNAAAFPRLRGFRFVSFVRSWHEIRPYSVW